MLKKKWKKNRKNNNRNKDMIKLNNRNLMLKLKDWKRKENKI